MGGMTAINLVVAERAGQIQRGYTAAHDDTHDCGEIARLAEYLLLANRADDMDSVERAACVILGSRRDSDVARWGTHICEKHDSNKIKMLTIAAALLVAEIERLQRLQDGKGVASGVQRRG